MARLPILRALTYPAALEGEAGYEHPWAIPLVSDNINTTGVTISSAWAADWMFVFDASKAQGASAFLATITTHTGSVAADLSVWVYDFAPTYDQNFYGYAKAGIDMSGAFSQSIGTTQTSRVYADQSAIDSNRERYWEAVVGGYDPLPFDTLLNGLMGVDNLGVLHVRARASNGGSIEVLLSQVNIYSDGTDEEIGGGWSVGEE